MRESLECELEGGVKDLRKVCWCVEGCRRGARCIRVNKGDVQLNVGVHLVSFRPCRVTLHVTLLTPLSTSIITVSFLFVSSAKGEVLRAVA